MLRNFQKKSLKCNAVENTSDIESEILSLKYTFERLLLNLGQNICLLRWKADKKVDSNPSPLLTVYVI